MIVGDVIDLESAGTAVAQHHVGGTGCVQRAEANDLPIQSDRADEGSAGELVVVDVVDFKPAATRDRFRRARH